MEDVFFLCVSRVSHGINFSEVKFELVNTEIRMMRNILIIILKSRTISVVLHNSSHKAYTLVLGNWKMTRLIFN